MASAGPDATGGVQLVELTRDQCLQLLSTRGIGRLLVIEGALPVAHTVTYLLDGEEIVFRTASASRLSAAALHTVVRFEIDHFDPRSAIGWCVLGLGEADEIVEPTRLADLANRLPLPWASGGHCQTLAISLQRLTGCRLTRSQQARERK